MSQLNRLLFICGLCLFRVLCSGTALAQPTIPNDMLANIKKAEAAMKVRDYNVARVLYQQVLAGDSNQYQACVQLAAIHKEQGEYSEAIRLLERAVRLTEANDMHWYELGLLYKYQADYPHAKRAFEQFQEKHGSKEDAFYLRSQREIEGCALGKELKKPQFYIKNLAINSGEREAFPVFYQGTKYLLFSSNRYQLVNKVPFSLLVMDRTDDSTFSAVTNEIALPASKKKAGGFSATVTKDGTTMYFTDNIKKRKHRFIHAIFESTFDSKSAKWGKPILVKKLVANKNLLVKGKMKPFPANNMNPSVSADGNTMVYCSDREDGKGGMDIWMTKKTPEGWTSPVNLGDGINTPFDDITPSLNPEGTRLYFASEGWGGYGGLDLYVSDMVEGNFQPIQHLAFPLNSTYDDFAAYNYENDSLFYFTSNRPGGAGREDLYWGKRVNYPDIAIPIVFSAIVVDGKTGLPLPFAEIEMTELGIGNEPKNLHVHKTDSHGSLRLNLESDKRYMMATLVDGYIPREIPILYKTEELEIPKEKNKEIRKTQEVLLFADTTGVTAAKDVAARYKIHNIYYDYDKYFIREDAAVELNKLVDLLQQHPNITIEVSSHTDTRASNEYNKHLSELRAMAAVKYIADKGIAPNRMTFQGMGETRPIYSPEKNELEQQMNRRTEFRITSVEYVAPPPPPAPIKQPTVDKKKK